MKCCCFFFSFAAAAAAVFVHCRHHFIASIHLFVWIYVTKSDRQTDRGGKTNNQTLSINIYVCVFVPVIFFSTNLWFGNIHRCDHVHDDFKWKISFFLLALLLRYELNSFLEWFLFRCCNCLSFIISYLFSIFNCFIHHIRVSFRGHLNYCVVDVRVCEWISFDLISFAS